MLCVPFVRNTFAHCKSSTQALVPSSITLYRDIKVMITFRFRRKLAISSALGNGRATKHRTIQHPLISIYQAITSKNLDSHHLEVT